MTGTRTARIAMVTLDVAEVQPSADFWSALLGWEVAASSDDYAMLTGPDGSPALGLGRIEDHPAPGVARHRPQAVPPRPRGRRRRRDDGASGRARRAARRPPAG